LLFSDTTNFILIALYVTEIIDSIFLKTPFFQEN